MSYRYLEEIATADVAFEAGGETVEEMFLSAADATMNVMVGDLDTITPTVHRTINVESDAIDMLLFELLQELIFYKDAEMLLLRASEIHIDQRDNQFRLTAETYGESIDPEKHDLIVDVKAVTLHRFKVERTHRGWEAMVILDI